jgi:transcriptional regulator with XRE-family HTH domain
MFSMETAPLKRGRRPIEVPLEDLPNRARILRVSLGLTPQHVANEIGVGISALTEFELHGTGIGRPRQFLLAEVLGVDYGTLLIPGKRFAEKIRQSLDNTSVVAV